jgi:hypothetical protein
VYLTCANTYTYKAQLLQPLQLGLLTAAHLWVFPRWSGNPTFLISAPDAPAWTVALQDAIYNTSLGSEGANLFYYTALSLLNRTQYSPYALYGNNTISRFQPLHVIRPTSGTKPIVEYSIGVDVLGRTIYSISEAYVAPVANVTSVLSYTSLVGLNVTVGIAVVSSAERSCT